MSFERSYHLANHKLTHEDFCPHSSIYCGERFTQAALLKQHMITHTLVNARISMRFVGSHSESIAQKSKLVTHTGDLVTYTLARSFLTVKTNLHTSYFVGRKTRFIYFIEYEIGS